MVTATSGSLNSKAAQNKAIRPPLLPSVPENGKEQRRAKSRDVTSRYLTTSCSSFSSLSSFSSKSSSSSTSSSFSSAPAKRCPSPNMSRTNPQMTPSVTKRSQSAVRKRPGTQRPDSLDPRGNREVPAAQALLLSSVRSLSMSFQGVSSTPISKTKLSQSPITVRKGTPERGSRMSAATTAKGPGLRKNSKPAEQWPRSNQPSSLSRSVDFSEERKRSIGSANNVVRALRTSIINHKTHSDRQSVVELADEKNRESNSNSAIRSDSVASDTESVSSDSTISGPSDGNGKGQKPTARGIVVPARFLQETTRRLHRQSEPGSPVSKSNGLKTLASSKLIVLPKNFGIEGSSSSPTGIPSSRGRLSPQRGPIRPDSPSKLATPSGSSPMRGMSPSRGLSPSRVRTSLTSVCNTPSILSFASDARRGTIGENRVAHAHSLRLSYNKLLQWRFVNAHTDYVLSAQWKSAERSLHNAWITISKLCDSVKEERTELQLLRQNLKLISILKGQMPYLEEWNCVDRDYTASLSAATEALMASTLRLPVAGQATANVQSLRDAVCSAVHVMQAMASSICYLFSKASGVSSLAAEIVKISLRERAMLDECKELLSTLTALQVTESSLRTHMVQQ